MGKVVKLNEDKLRNIIISEVRKMVNEAHVKSTDELAGGDYVKMCGTLKGKIEALYTWMDYCDTLEKLQELIDRTFGDIME